MLIFWEIFCLKCQNLRKLQGCEKYKNDENPRAFLLQIDLPLKSKYLIIDNDSLSYNLMEPYVSPFLQIYIIKFIVKGFIMLKI
jgi:hypothetical protein